MRLTRLYHPQPLALNELVELTPTAFQHAIKVLRLAEQSPIILFNSESGEFLGTIERIGKRQAWVRLSQSRRQKDSVMPNIHLGQAIVSGQKMDWIIQKTTELGVNAITPLYTDYSQVNLSAERTAKRMEHWQKVAISAAEQCERIQIPELYKPTPLSEWLAQDVSQTTLMLHPTADKPLNTLLNEINPPNLRILIGPEGGFSKQEINLAQQNSAQLAKLGQFILRTETAAMMSVGLTGLILCNKPNP